MYLFDIEVISVGYVRIGFVNVHEMTAALRVWGFIGVRLYWSAAGYRNNSSGGINNVGSNGNYWSAAANSTANAYNLNFNSGNVNPTNANNRANGFSVVPCSSSVLGKLTMVALAKNILFKGMFFLFF